MHGMVLTIANGPADNRMENLFCVVFGYRQFNDVARTLVEMING